MGIKVKRIGLPADGGRRRGGPGPGAGGDGPPPDGSIAAVRIGGLGDLLVVLPSLRLLRGAFPAARLTLIARPEYGRLLSACDVVDAVERADDPRWMPLFAGSAPGGPPSPLVPGPDLAVGWFHSRAGEGFAGRARGLWPRARTFGWTARPEEGLLSRQFFEALSASIGLEGRPLPTFEECARLPLPTAWASEGPSAAGMPPDARPLAVVHPGSGSAGKTWPLDRFLEIVRRLARRGFAGVLVTGEAEEDRIVRRDFGPLPRRWIGIHRPSLPVLAGLLASASLYAGNDSGVSHLAAVCGAAGVAIFRTEYVRAWAPGGRIAVLAAADPADIPASVVGDVLDALPPI